MKRLAFLALMLAAPLRAEDRQISESSGTIYGSTQTWAYTSTSTFINISTMTWGAWDGPRFEISLDRHNNLRFTSKDKTFLRIDGDGDIFVRDKWVGWDARAKGFIKAWKRAYSW